MADTVYVLFALTCLLILYLDSRYSNPAPTDLSREREVIDQNS